MTLSTNKSSQQIVIEDDRTGLNIDTIRRAIADNLFYLQGKLPKTATINDYYLALAYTVRDRLLQRWLATAQTYFKPDVKVVCYFSAEFLVGPHLANNLINLGIYDRVLQAVEESGLNFTQLIEGAVENKVVSENLTKVLYPNDEQMKGKKLRLQQQYFFVSCSLQDMIRIHLTESDSLDNFHEKFAAQLNDTHPAIAVAELMRLLVDEHNLNWDRAWNITQNTLGYTNHTLLPEALEKWSLSLFSSLLPRHLAIIYEINRQFLDRVMGDVVNNDPDIGERLKVVFLPDYNVKLAQRVYPAADLSEQISMAGKEASGTGNMKFSLNGALTIGTLDGANVEIREEVGEENFFLFGLKSHEVDRLKAQGYNPYDYYVNNSELKAVIDRLAGGDFSQGNKELFKSMIDNLLHNDPYLLLADYQSYIECQDRVSQAYNNQENWTRMSILNVARMGKFSSDRSIREYCEYIWDVKAVPIELTEYSQANAALQV